MIIDLGVSQQPDMNTTMYFNNDSDETGYAFYALLLTIRSSLALKHSLRAINPVAIIDSDYTDTIKFGITNDGKDPYTIKEGDRICQGVFVRFLTSSDDIVLKENRTGGIGSTGK